MRKYIKKVLSFILNYHIQIILLGIISYLLLNNNAPANHIYYFDTDFIRTKFALRLAESKKLTEAQIREEFLSLETEIKKFSQELGSEGLLLKKSSVISGGIDITIQVCMELGFSNCNTYE